ncbi:MAG: hypothetical protein ACXABY_05190 [Candidatus Thorarchaeota archaeon]
MMEVVEVAREKLAKITYYQHVTSGFVWENEGQWFKDKYLGYANQILNLTFEHEGKKYTIGIIEVDAELPPALYGGYDEGNLRFTEEAVKQDILRAGYQKVV